MAGRGQAKMAAVQAAWPMEDGNRDDLADATQPRILQPGWFSPNADPILLASAGIKTAGGGPHQSKTMMLAELSAVLAGGHGESPTNAVMAENLLGKPSLRAREAALYRLRQFYGIGLIDPICLALRRLWSRDPDAQATLALICALARDPSFRDGAPAVLDATIGEKVRWPAIAACFEALNPGRLGDRMAKSLAQNVASSWTQAGFLKGAIRKERVRPMATPVTAAYAALIASMCGFGGARLLASRWMDVLDRPIEDRIGLLRQAEGLGLLRVRSAGDVLEIDVRRPMAEMLGVPELGG